MSDSGEATAQVERILSVTKVLAPGTSLSLAYGQLVIFSSIKSAWNSLATRTAWEFILAAAAAKLLQSCPTLCDPIDGSPPGFSVPGILQARALEWVAISFSNAWKWKVSVKSLSHVPLLAIPWTAGHQAPPSMGFSRQEYWSSVPLPSPHIYTNNFITSSDMDGTIPEI